jgi:hypothetical protein
MLGLMFCTVWKRKVFFCKLKKIKICVTFSILWGVCIVCSCFHYMEELYSEHTEMLLFSSRCSFWEKLCNIFLVIYYFWCQNLNEYVLFVFLPSQDILLPSERDFPFRKPWLAWIILWFQNVFFIVFQRWFWQTSLGYDICRPVRITVSHIFCYFLLSWCS